MTDIHTHHPTGYPADPDDEPRIRRNDIRTTITCPECNATVELSREIGTPVQETFRAYLWDESPGGAALCPHCGTLL